MKSLTSDNYLTRPFFAFKGWAYRYTQFGINSSSVSINLASLPPASWANFDPNTSPQNSNGLYTQTLYQSIQNYFYNSGSPFDRSVIVSPTDKEFYPTGSNFYVVNLHQSTIGEGVHRSSFELTSPSSTASISDNGQGLLISSVNGNVVGNIFYGLGVAVIKQDTGSYSSSLVTDQGLYLYTGSIVDVRFESVYTIYEHLALCTIEPGEMNFSNNPTTRNATVSGSGQYDGPVARDLFVSGTLTPYITTVGLYNNAYELVAVAKLPRPIKRAPEVQQTFIVRFDS